MAGHGAWPFVRFTLAVLALVAVDLGISARRRGPPTTRVAATWSVVWVALALGFGLWVARARGPDDALVYVAAYLTEESLSLDNVVVFVAVFAYFGVPVAYQHRVLFWGILGAVVMRGAMIAAGVALLDRFAWVTYVFGAFLVFAGVRMLRRRGAPAESGGGLLRLVARFVPVTEECRDAAFFRRVDGRWSVTPLFVALVDHFWPAKITARWEPPVGDRAWRHAAESASAPAASAPRGGARSGDCAHSILVSDGPRSVDVRVVGDWARVLVTRCAAPSIALDSGASPTRRPDELWLLRVSARWKIVHLESAAPAGATPPR